MNQKLISPAMALCYIARLPSSGLLVLTRAIFFSPERVHTQRALPPSPPIAVDAGRVEAASVVVLLRERVYATTNSSAARIVMTGDHDSR